MKKIEGHLQILQWFHILVVTFKALIIAGFVLTMLENCHHFTLRALLSNKNINFAGGKFRVKKRGELEEVDIKNRKFGFSLLIKFSPFYFYKRCHLR